MRRIELAWALPFAMAGSLLAAPAYAQTELEAVREMLKLDAERALALERERSPGKPRAAVAAPTVRSDRVVVAAIYGIVGKRTAILTVNGERKEYREGSEVPQGHLASAREYRLVRIDHGCVHLAKAASRDTRVACYFPAPDGEPGRRGEAQPALAPIGRLPPALGMPLPLRDAPR